MLRQLGVGQVIKKQFKITYLWYTMIPFLSALPCSVLISVSYCLRGVGVRPVPSHMGPKRPRLSWGLGSTGYIPWCRWHTPQPQGCQDSLTGLQWGLTMWPGEVIVGIRSVKLH
jgi:hypothetical protein